MKKILTFLLLSMAVFTSKAGNFLTADSPAVAVVPNQQLPAGKDSTATAPIVVYDVYKLGHENDKDEKRYSAGLGDVIVVKVHGFTTLLNMANPVNGTKQDIKLFLDGRQIDDIVPTSGAPQKDDGELQFRLQRSAANNSVWSDLMGAPSFTNLFLRPTKISVGLSGSYAQNSTVKNFDLIRIRQSWFYCCLVGLLFYIFLVLRFGINSPMLRDSGVDLTALGFPKVADLPFSLGKVQMAFWFSIVLASFLFIWLITGNYDIITTGVLGLIGISAATALGAVAIDSNKKQQVITDITAMQQQAATLQSDITALQAIQPPTPESTTGIVAKTAELNQLNAKIQAEANSVLVHSDGFIQDILTDVNGVSFHRLQMFIWTFVLALIFIESVWASLIMPDFSSTLLTLQGITAGTYLGFKFPEKQG